MVLFIAYIILALLLKKKQNWNYPTLGIILAASLVPFGTFYVEKYCKMFKSAAKIFEFYIPFVEK
jgi:integral membrane protein